MYNQNIKFTMEEIKTKVCTKCGRELSIENFYINKSLKGGRDNCCKECKNAYAKEWARANTEAAFVRSACIEMSEWADKTMIDKACEWLKKHYAPAGFVDGVFRKAMEE